MSSRFAVLGSPVQHSLSPVLHRAAFTALSLSFTYERVECDEHRLPQLIAEPGWTGFSVTMPGKHVALTAADRVTDRARAVGAANTLVRTDEGWLADCTDVDGVSGALRSAAGLSYVDSALILGAGGTTLAAIVALAGMGAQEITLAVRNPDRAADAVRCAEQQGLRTRVLRLGATDLSGLAAHSSVTISTLPGGAADGYVSELVRAPALLDVIYHPWPTPLATAAKAKGIAFATGLDMLLHQAFGQAEHFTGMPAPREAMRDALRIATGNELELPL
ncbi:shikimate dehydrogenase [Pseudonocardiaceae bacterium YIM PH 21723]|nr:shikimate dehydrogenase [Pseudonocardiaceae bacterium YIM PH 21723]